ncbi:hypothetical protein [Cellulosilyticum ruminicola]|uniref:hypothetical protein n=1 Tax=Cellulosilyticum ruminicola TaxID=425254 RepID=UPI0006D255F7|nr:hypothetical protein [Cellulosilyticum ruminicola]
MNCSTVIPNKGIGPIQLGMSKSEIDALFDAEDIEIQQIDTLFINDEEKHQLLSVRYDDSKFIVLYDAHHMAIEISAVIDFFKAPPLTLYDINLLESSAEDIIPLLSHYAPSTYDGADKDLSTTYIFEDLGITLWRESGFHSKLLTQLSQLKSLNKA